MCCVLGIASLQCMDNGGRENSNDSGRERTIRLIMWCRLRRTRLTKPDVPREYLHQHGYTYSSSSHGRTRDVEKCRLRMCHKPMGLKYIEQRPWRSLWYCDIPMVCNMHYPLRQIQLSQKFVRNIDHSWRVATPTTCVRQYNRSYTSTIEQTDEARVTTRSSRSKKNTLDVKHMIYNGRV